MLNHHRPADMPPGRRAAAARFGPERASDARTLYLASAEALRVTSTGEALIVSQPDGRVARLPVARLLRIVCTDTAEWSGAALALCMHRAIPITWLDRHGEAAGHLWPQRVRGVDLDNALDILAAEEPQWPARYSHWLRGRRLAVLKRWAAQREAANQPVSAQEWDCAKRRYVYLGEIPQLLPSLLGGMAAALVAARLSESGLQPHYWGVSGTALELADDLGALLWGEMNLCSGLLASALDRPAEAAAIFERCAGTYAGALHEHLASLRVHALRELGV